MRHVPGSLFMADVDDADPPVDAGVVDRPDVPAVEAEDQLDACVAERLGDEDAAVRTCLRLRAFQEPS
jgi:hypothetical protein